MLVEDPDKSYHAARRVSENDIFDNRLIFGDNLLALEALGKKFTKSSIFSLTRCTIQRTLLNNNDDGLEHSPWPSLIRDRLERVSKIITERVFTWVKQDTMRTRANTPIRSRP